MEGYQLYFDRLDKTFKTENGKLTIRPPLSEAMRKEELSGTELATTDFVLRTGNATMYVYFEIITMCCTVLLFHILVVMVAEEKPIAKG